MVLARRLATVRRLDMVTEARRVDTTARRVDMVARRVDMTARRVDMVARRVDTTARRVDMVAPRDLEAHFRTTAIIDQSNFVRQTNGGRREQ
jgi:hypothetical protein